MNEWTEPAETLGDIDYAERLKEADREASPAVWCVVGVIGMSIACALGKWGFSGGVTLP